MQLLRGAIVAISVAAAVPAQAATVYSFHNITGNSAVSAAIGEAQLRMTVDLVGSAVNFHFTNVGAQPCSITRVYFDERKSMLGTASIFDSGAGVDFLPNVGPANLPGRNNVTPHFVTTREFGATPPTQPNGVNASAVQPGEWLDLRFTFKGTADLSTIIAALADAQLRVGLHVQGFANGQSEAFVDEPGGEDVPLPSALGLALAGFGTLTAVRRRRSC